MELLQKAASRMITVMNHTSKDDIKTYTDKYLNQTEQELLDCVKRLRPSSPTISEIEEPRNQDEREHSGSQRFRITQGGSNFQGSNLVCGSSQFQGNFIGSEQAFSSRRCRRGFDLVEFARFTEYGWDAE
jgi:hypothetical protein